MESINANCKWLILYFIFEVMVGWIIHGLIEVLTIVPKRKKKKGKKDSLAIRIYILWVPSLIDKNTYPKFYYLSNKIFIVNQAIL